MGHLRRRSVGQLFVASLLNLMPRWASAEKPKVRRIDNRHTVDSDGSAFYVIFCARTSGGQSGLPGHGFVIWGAEDSAQRMSSNAAYGFYPAEAGTKMVFGTVPGALRDEFINPKETMDSVVSMLYVRVNRDDFDASRNVYKNWETTDYNLYSRNCISFAKAVADGMHLNGFSEAVTEYPVVYFSVLAGVLQPTFGGAWTCSPARLKLSIEGPEISWAEGRKADGAVLTKKVFGGSSSTSKTLVVARETTDEVLQFLYPSFSPALRSQVLARKPEPMTLTLERSGEKLTGTWRRLGVKLRADGSLDSILQPSAGQAFAVSFSK